MWNFEQGDSTLLASSTVQAAARPSNWFTWRNSCHSTISKKDEESSIRHTRRRLCNKKRNEDSIFLVETSINDVDSRKKRN